jgi:2-C-methyl-D-erythritol 4-phosphate cytidylyltransferase / 2-C-methyl-D-erythritol 2,4-cyclodiphosphate synthase
METVALIVAAGRGERAGGVIPKQFALLGGVPVIARAVDAFGDLPVFVVVEAGQQKALAAALESRIVTGVVTGGATRQESVRNGLAAIAAAGGADKVLVHDAARPLLPRAVLDALVLALDTHDAAVPVLPVADTLAKAEERRSSTSSAKSVGELASSPDLAELVEAPSSFLGDTVPRDALLRVQTPQAFRMAALMTSLSSWTGEAATDEAQVVRAAGFAVATVPGDAMLDKITHPADFARAEAMLAARMISRSATGYDVHRLAEGEELWLGGIRIPHTHGLSGHSDADVALHAITDAVLGTIGAGDIGSHFPPSDAQWRGASSDRFLAHAASLVRAAGGVIDFVDLTLICEAPKIGPHREAIRARVADILQVPSRRISIKATTTERLGFTGRGEGIAAQAIATVRVPEDM